LNAAVVALIAVTAWRIGRSTLSKPWQWYITLFSGLAVIMFEATVIEVVLLSGLAGIYIDSFAERRWQRWRRIRRLAARRRAELAEAESRAFVGGFKVGPRLSMRYGEGLLKEIARHGNMFVDSKFFDIPNTSGFEDGASVYVPFNRAIDLKLPNDGNNNCAKDPGEGWENYLRSECIWLSLWTELPTKAEAQSYREYLTGYAAEMQRSGRFSWPPNVRLRNVMDWLSVQKVVPRESQVSLLVSLGFLVICLVNTIGLLLAKFMRRAPEIGVRRALGASRRDIYAQFLIEAGTIGIAGGVLGLLLTGLGVLSVGLVFREEIARLATLDPTLMLLTLVVAIVASVLAAFYPTWRAAQVQPAWQLKSN